MDGLGPGVILSKLEFIRTNFTSKLVINLFTCTSEGPGPGLAVQVDGLGPGCGSVFVGVETFVAVTEALFI